MLGLYKLHVDCGRQGTLTGLFIADTVEVDNLITSEKEIYFGEVLGKHSEVYGALEEKDVTLVSTEVSVIDMVTKYNLENGYNPFDYISKE